MKLTLFIIFAALLQVSAKAYAQKISLKQENTALTTIFKDIRTQTGYNFVYDAGLMRLALPVTVSVKGMDLVDVLKICFKDQPFTYEVIHKTIVIKEKPSLKRVSDTVKITVHGQVVDEQGKPLPGASVQVGEAPSLTGTIQTQLIVTTKRFVAITNANGNFTITGLPENSILTISFIGYESKTVKATSNLGQIKLTPESKSLSEVNVVNTGYQTLSRDRSAGAFSKPDMQQFNNANSGSNIISRLDGLVPGLAINNSPDATAAGNSVLIRGITSINEGRAPLYVVDGLPQSDITNVNYNDVQDITVLKDATAASIWGAKAANGVIVITTKRGKGNEKLTIDYDVNYSFQEKPNLNYLNLMNSQQYIQTIKQIYNDNYLATNPNVLGQPVAVPPDEQIEYERYGGKITASQANAKLDSLAAINNKRQISSLFYRNPLTANHTLSVSGGGKVHTFRGSFSYTDTRDNMPGDKNNGYNFLLRNDLNLSNRISVYLITQLDDINTSSLNYAANRPATNVVPYQLYKDKNGNNLNATWQYYPDSLARNYQAISGINTSYVPLDDARQASTTTNSLYAKANGGITIKLFDGLRFEGTYGIEKSYGKNTNFYDQQSFNVRHTQLQFTSRPATPGGAPTYYLPMNGGTLNAINNDLQNWTLRNQLVYDKNWDKGKHQLTLLAGQEADDNISNSTTTQLLGWDPQLLTYSLVNYQSLSVNPVPNPVVVNGAGGGLTYNALPYYATTIETRFTSYYANAAYTYLHKYTLNGSFRNDQSNLFGEDRAAQKKPVWSTGGSWLLSNEKFMQSLTWLNRLVVRTSYGITGNSPTPGTAASFNIARPVQGLTSIFPAGVLSISSPANSALTWEETRTINFGLDFSVLRDRISGSLNAYKKNTSNLIGQLPVNAFTSYSIITGNYGDMINKGIELNLTTINVVSSNFRWSTSVNFAYNKNKITRLQNSTAIQFGSQLVTNPLAYLQGYPSDAVFAYRYAGLNNVGNPQIRLADNSVTSAKNVAKPDDVRFMGTLEPIYSGGFINSISFKQFSLSANIVYNGGNVMRRDVNGNNTQSIFEGPVTNNLPTLFADRWQKPGDELKTNVPAYSSYIVSTQRDINYYTLGDINVLDASFVKLRDLMVSYQLPAALLTRIGVQAITLRAGISNIMLWTANHYGIDPEFQGSSYYSSYRTLPTNQHTVTLGAHITIK